MRTLRAIPNFDPQSVLSKVDFRHDEDCWEWQGNIDTYGYGTYGHANYMVHRVVYELIVEMLEPVDTLDHLCFNRACVNPNHLEKVPFDVNVLRGNNPHAINKRKTHCLNGHEFTPENTYIHPKRGNRHCKRCQRSRKSTSLIKKERIALSLSI